MEKIIKNKIVYEQNINNINGKALAVIFPDDIQELKNLVKLSKEDIIPRGNGTSFTGACIPKNSLVIDFSKMNKIIEINPSKKTAIVEPGVLLHDLNAELESYGLELPIEPLFGGLETIGGMIAKNSSGNREIKYGRMISWVDSLEVINGKGEQLKISRSDLSDFVGMEGSTGLIIKAILRLTNLKKRSLTILKVNTIQDVFIANRKLRLKQDISAIDMINPEIAQFLGLEKKYHLFVELSSLEGTFKDENYEKFIKLRNKAYKKAAIEGFCYMSNVKLLIDSLQDFLIYLEEKKIPYFAHLASGVVYPLFRLADLDKMQEAMKFAKKLRGKIAYNFGIGLTKKDSLDLGEIELIKRAKNRQDPQWKMNKDKLIDLKLMSQSNITSKEENRDANEEIEINKEMDTKESSEAEDQAENEAEDLIQNADNPVPEQSSMPTLKRPQAELSQEEKDKIKKIAGGFFGGKKSQ